MNDAVNSSRKRKMLRATNEKLVKTCDSLSTSHKSKYQQKRRIKWSSG
jgi:hypothetical protein